jgi:hypothetical protein
MRRPVGVEITVESRDRSIDELELIEQCGAGQV